MTMTKLTKFYSKIAAFGLSLSAASIVFFNSSWNYTNTNLLDAPPFSVFDIANSSNNDLYKGNQYRINCPYDPNKRLCGIRVAVDSLDLNDNDVLRLESQVTSTNEKYDGRIRVRLWSRDESQILKPHSARLNPNEKQTLSLDSFTVDPWWLDKHKINHKQAAPSLRNIIYFEVLVNDVPIMEPGNYTVSLKNVHVEKTILSKTTLLWGNLLFWLGLIFAGAGHFYFRSKKSMYQLVDELAYGLQSPTRTVMSNPNATKRIAWHIKEALDNDLFYLVFMPIVNEKGQITAQRHFFAPKATYSHKSALNLTYKWLKSLE